MDKEKSDHLEERRAYNEDRSYSVDDSGRRLSVTGRRVSVVDDVFGELVEGGPNYRNVGLSQDVILQQLTVPDRSVGWEPLPSR